MNMLEYARIWQLNKELGIADICTRMAENPFAIDGKYIVEKLRGFCSVRNENNIMAEINAKMFTTVEETLKVHYGEDATIDDMLFDMVAERMAIIECCWCEYKNTLQGVHNDVR